MRRQLGFHRPGADEGFTLVEALAAMLVFALVMAGLIASLVQFTKTTLLTRVRANATTLAQQMVEQARALDFADLQVQDASGVPSTGQLNGTGSSYPVVKSSTCTACLSYAPPDKVVHGVTYKVRQLVLLADSGTGSDGQPQKEKYLSVVVSWTTPSAGSYELDTTINNQDALSAQAQQGISAEVYDTNGNQITDDTLFWDITVTDTTGAVVASGQTSDGSWWNYTIAVGNYTCTMSTDSAGNTSGWSPAGNPGASSVSTPCSVTSGTVFDWKPQWSSGTSSTSCTTGGSNGTFAVTVTDGNGNYVQNAVATVTDWTGKAQTLPGTNGSGYSQKGVPPGSYTYSVAAPSNTNYASTGTLGPVCIVSGKTANVAVSLVMSATPTYFVNATVPVNNQTTGTRTYDVVLMDSKGTTTSQTGSVAKGATTNFSFSSLPADYYNVLVCIPQSDGTCTTIFQSTYNWTVGDVASKPKNYTTPKVVDK